MASKYITELLAELNEDPNLMLTQYRRRGEGSTLFSELIEAAFDPAKGFLLPKTRPRFVPNPKPIGLCESNVMAEVSRFYIYRSTSLTKFRREVLFIQALERVSAQEAEILLAVKDQNLTSLYPNLTPNLIWEAGYIPLEAVKPLEAAQAGLVEVRKANGNVIVTAADVETIGKNILAGITPQPIVEEEYVPEAEQQNPTVSAPLPAEPELSLKDQCRSFYDQSGDKSKATFMAYSVGVLGIGKNVANNYYYAIKKEYDAKNQEAPLGA